MPAPLPPNPPLEIDCKLQVELIRPCWHWDKLDECLNYLREGDTLVVTRIDRLARSLRDLKTLFTI